MADRTTDPLAFLTLDSFVTSDHHWSHDNIRKYQDRPEGHFQIMRDRWFEAVGWNDVVLHLGDLVCYGDTREHPKYISALTGRKYLLKGNHDKHSDQWYGAANFTVLGRHPILWIEPESEMLVLFSHEPVSSEHEPWDVNVHGHTHLNKPYATLGRLEDRVNVCVEHTDYAPVRLREVLRSFL